jgi:hypothetical protein
MYAQIIIMIILKSSVRRPHNRPPNRPRWVRISRQGIWHRKLKIPVVPVVLFSFTALIALELIE